jgi:hypothetical protein
MVNDPLIGVGMNFPFICYALNRYGVYEGNPKKGRAMLILRLLGAIVGMVTTAQKNRHTDMSIRETISLLQTTLIPLI